MQTATLMSRTSLEQRIAEAKAHVADIRADIATIVNSTGFGSTRHADRVTELHAALRTLWRYEDAYYAGL